MAKSPSEATRLDAGEEINVVKRFEVAGTLQLQSSLSRRLLHDVGAGEACDRQLHLSIQ